MKVIEHSKRIGEKEAKALVWQGDMEVKIPPTIWMETEEYKEAQ